MTTSDHELSAEQQQLFDAACASINQDRLQRLIFDLTEIHSPTGAERAASEFLVDYLRGVGIEAEYQAINESTGNCIGRIKGTGGGPTLMFDSPSKHPGRMVSQKFGRLSLVL